MRQKYSIGQPARIIGKSPESAICGAVVLDGVTLYALVGVATFGRPGWWRRYETTGRESGGYGGAVLGEVVIHGSEVKCSFLGRR